MNVNNICNKIYDEILTRCGVKPEENDKVESEVSGIGSGIGFERIRRITGYISGDYISRFNNAKRAEVEDRTNEHGRTENYHH